MLIALLLVIGCGKDKMTDPAQQQGFPVNMTMIEMFEYSQSSLAFLLATDQIYGCFNNEIVNEVLWRGSSINIIIEGIYFPELCLTALGPATARIELGALSPGEYNITISNGTFSTFKLIVTEDDYRIEPVTISNLTINNSLLIRE